MTHNKEHKDFQEYEFSIKDQSVVHSIDLEVYACQKVAQGTQRVFPPKFFQLMFGVRTQSLKSLVSKQWSTSELTAGMEHLLTDMRNEMPDEVAHLEAHHAADHQSRTHRHNFLGSADGLQKPCGFVGRHVFSHSLEIF